MQLSALLLSLHEGHNLQRVKLSFQSCGLHVLLFRQLLLIDYPQNVVLVAAEAYTLCYITLH